MEETMNKISVCIYATKNPYTEKAIDYLSKRINASITVDLQNAPIASFKPEINEDLAVFIADRNPINDFLQDRMDEVINLGKIAILIKDDAWTGGGAISTIVRVYAKGFYGTVTIEKIKTIGLLHASESIQQYVDALYPNPKLSTSTIIAKYESDRRLGRKK